MDVTTAWAVRSGAGSVLVGLLLVLLAALELELLLVLLIVLLVDAASGL